MKRARYQQKVVLIALCVFLSLVLIGLIFVTAYVHHLINMVGRVDPNEGTLSLEDLATMTEETDPDYTGSEVDPTDITIDILPTVPGGSANKEEIVNILLVGQDRREGEKRQRSDVMLLCTINPKKNTLTLTSFLRDTYAFVPDYGYKKLNAAYAYGGFRLLNETLAVNFGVHVDANVEVDFFGFTKIIDLLGGVEIELSQKEADYMNEHMGFEYNQDEQWNLKAGKNHLNGDQALAYSRIRKIDSDFGRTRRQRTVLMALLQAYKNKPLTEMLGLVDDILPMVSTDLSNQEILRYVVDFFPMLSGATFDTMHIPAKGTYESEYVTGLGACLIPDLEENRAILDSLFATD